MCGIAGYFNYEKLIYSLNDLYQATKLISHRGPDDEGYAFFNIAEKLHLSLTGPDSPNSLKERFPEIHSSQRFGHNLAFGFRRFSVVDLSDKGHQPFWNNDNSICLIFNGEVYNYVEIRNELEMLGYSFLTNCDTEVMLIGYQAWGMMGILQRCNGPIALILFDRRKDRLYWARDRIGKSPLYYALSNGTLYWASEIKSILSMAGSDRFPVNEQAVYDYLTYGWRDLDNMTFWKGIRTFPAACWIEFELSVKPDYETINDKCHRYWNIPLTMRTSFREISFYKAKEHFTELFEDAVKIRSRADAKVAFSLSGGLDSSSIVAIAAKTLSKPFRTYSIKFQEELQQDEEPLARSVYETYPNMIDYQTYTPKNDDFWEVANDYIWLQEEPFHFPNAELFQAYFRKARGDNYKVMIIGAGGDELLAGYNDYFFPLLYELWNRKNYLPVLSNLYLNTNMWSKYLIRKRCKVIYDLWRGNIDNILTRNPVSFFNPSGILWSHIYLKDITIETQSVKGQRPVPTQFHEVMVGYMSNWLMNYWQRNGNKSHFGVPMETRSPFLDHRLIDFVFTLPPEYIVNYGWTKYILRKSVNKLLPKSVIWNRKKQGLPFNTHSWFRHSKPIIETQLKSVSENPYINTTKVMNHYDELLVRQPTALWRAINFCLWWKRVIMKDCL